MKNVLLTGAAGGVGTHLRKELGARYTWRLSDLRSPGDLGVSQAFVKADLADLDAALAATEGMEGIVHLGGYSVEGPWEPILEANIVGCYNVFEAARRNGVKRVVFASSNHAVGFYRRDEVIDHRVYPRPDGRYGLSKAFGEALGRLYSDKYGLEVCCIRIGNVDVKPVDKRRLSIWVSPRDLAQLVVIGLEHPEIRFEVVYGVSGNARSWYDNSNAVRLGYRPLDDAESFAEEVLKNEPAGADPRSETFQGGAFVVSEHIPLPGGTPRTGTRKAKRRG